MTRTLQMKLTDEPTIITTVGDKFGNNGRIRRETFIPISSVVDTRRIHASHKTRTTRSTNWTLAISMRESHSTID